MKIKLLKTFFYISNFLFWLWIIIGTPLLLYGIYWSYDDGFMKEFIQAIINGLLFYGFVLAIFWSSRKFAQKLLKSQA